MAILQEEKSNSYYKMIDLMSWTLNQILLVSSLYPGTCFSKAQETFRARKAIFSSSVSKNGEVCTPETSCMKGTCLHIKNMGIKQFCNCKVPDFAMAFRARKVSGAFEKRAPG